MATPVGGSRKLTQGEEALAKLMFGNSIDYSKVLIRNKKYRVFGFPPADDVIVTPDGTMYCGPASFKEDFTEGGNPHSIRYFIHEMVHVWQYQLGYPMVIAGIASVFRANYDYTLKKDSKLSDFKIEGQANIISDYAMYVIFPDSTEVYSSKTRYKKEPYSFQELREIVKDFLLDPRDLKNLPYDENVKVH
jgi:type VI secretion system secreted protein VgrG